MQALVIVAVSSVLLIGNIGIQSAEAGSDANCPSKSGAATTIDPNAPNSVNTNLITSPQPTV